MTGVIRHYGRAALRAPGDGLDAVGATVHAGREIVFVDALPRSEQGKVLKRELRDEASSS